MTLTKSSEEQTAIYFISDLHLEPSRPDISSAFRSFLDSSRKDAKSLFILGDLFESWIGDDDNAPFVTQIKSILRAYSDAGISVFFSHGNRDFVIGERFAEETGITLLREEQLIELADDTVLVLHGDQLCTDDTDYQAFREKVRDIEWQQRMLRFPLWVRKLIASYLRYRSRKAHKNKSMAIMDVNQDAVIAMMEKHRVLTMIHGHTHRPQIHTLSTKDGDAKRVVLGDWDTLGWYYRVDHTSAELVSFPLTSSDASKTPE